MPQLAPRLLPDPDPTAALATAGCSLPLPAPGWGLPEALAALEAARAGLTVALTGPPSVRSQLTTVVLSVGEHVVKVYPHGTDARHLDRLQSVLRGSLSATVSDGPAVPTPHGLVTTARRLPGGPAVTWPEVGAVLRRFHAEHSGGAVPEWRPLSRLDSQAATLPDEQAEVLYTARDVLLAALAEVRSELGHDVIHGDVAPSNVMRDGSGITLIDLDWVARAPREYDLSSAARRFRAGEIDRSTYLAFCQAYGHDVLGWEGLPLMDRVADLAGVVFRIWDCRHHGRDLGWLPGELRLWRTPL